MSDDTASNCGATSGRATGTFKMPPPWHHFMADQNEPSEGSIFHPHYSGFLAPWACKELERWQSSFDEANAASQELVSFCEGASDVSAATARKFFIATNIGLMAEQSQRFPAFKPMHDQYSRSGMAKTYTALQPKFDFAKGDKGQRTCDAVGDALTNTAISELSGIEPVMQSYLDAAENDPEMPALLKDLNARAARAKQSQTSSWRQ